jgi:hypothetical protein
MCRKAYQKPIRSLSLMNLLRADMMLKCADQTQRAGGAERQAAYHQAHDHKEGTDAYSVLDDSSASSHEECSTRLLAREERMCANSSSVALRCASCDKASLPGTTTSLSSSCCTPVMMSVGPKSLSSGLEVPKRPCAVCIRRERFMGRGTSASPFGITSVLSSLRSSCRQSSPALKQCRSHTNNGESSQVQHAQHPHDLMVFCRWWMSGNE